MPKAGAKTLCIPTVFVSYTGEALDYKAPLLKSVAFLKSASTDVCHYFDKNVKTCSISLGIEQEYFLVDEQQFKSRPDLMFAGRTLIGEIAQPKANSWKITISEVSQIVCWRSWRILKSVLTCWEFPSEPVIMKLLRLSLNVHLNMRI